MATPPLLRRHFCVDKPQAIFKTERGIINNKSELGTRAESLLPELSSPFEMSDARVKQDRGYKTKNKFKS